MSNSLISINKLTRHPKASCFYNIFLKEVSVKTLMGWAWKYGHNHLANVTNMKASISTLRPIGRDLCSILAFESPRALLLELLTWHGVRLLDIRSVSHCSGRLSSGGLDRHYFSVWNTWSQSSCQGCTLHKTLQNGRHLSLDLETNLFNDATLLVSLLVSSIFRGASYLWSLWFSLCWLLFLSQTFWDLEFSRVDTKAYLVGFNFILYWHNTTKPSLKSCRCCDGYLLLTSRSSIYEYASWAFNLQNFNTLP